MSEEITAARILHLLQEWYLPPEWATFAELRTGTGYGQGRQQRIDLFAINLWPSKRNGDGVPLSLAFEIKVSRADFRKELENPGKRAIAEQTASECWFAAPAGLVKKEEVPEGWGLVSATRKGLVRSKLAKQRSPEPWSWDFISALCRRLADSKPEGPKRAWRYADRDLTKEELEAVAVEVFKQSVGSQKNAILREFKDSDQYQELVALQQTVRELVGWGTDAEGFREWFKANRGMSHRSLHQIRHAYESLGRVLETEDPKDDD